MGIEYHYERQKHEYEVGEVVHNLNGNDYKVLEKYTDTKLLLIAKRTGEFVVAIDCAEFSKAPKDAPELVEIGTEWGHGVYLGNNPDNIDFAALRREYCPAEERVLDMELPDKKR